MYFTEQQRILRVTHCVLAWYMLLQFCLSVHYTCVLRQNMAEQIEPVYLNDYLSLVLHCVSKKGPTCKLSVTLSNLNRFSKFLHC